MKTWNRGITGGVQFQGPCRDCKPPKRTPYCRAECWAYLEAKAKFDIEANAERAARKAVRDSESVVFLMKRG